MQPLAVRILYVVLIAVYGGVSSVAAVETKYPDGGFEPRLDKLQGLLDHIRTVEKVKVQAGPKLWQAITAIPVATGVPITPEQEADLRDWLYDFLVAFSVSGNDSLAAQFYLREGVNNPRALKNMKETLERWGIPQGDTPFASSSKPCTEPYSTIRAMTTALATPSFATARSRCSRCRATTSAIELTRGMLSSRATTSARTRGMLSRPDSKLQQEVDRALRAGEKRLFTDIAFVTEESAALTGPKGPICTPFFCRLVWDPERAMWRFVEVVYNSKRPNSFLFSAI